jgi:hypothetical protein
MNTIKQLQLRALLPLLLLLGALSPVGVSFAAGGITVTGDCYSRATYVGDTRICGSIVFTGIHD